MKKIAFILLVVILPFASWSFNIKHYDIKGVITSEQSIEFSGYIFIDNISECKIPLLLNKKNTSELNFFIEKDGLKQNLKFTQNADTLLIEWPFGENAAISFNYYYTNISSPVTLLRREEKWYPLNFDDLFTYSVNITTPQGFSVISSAGSKNKKIEKEISSEEKETPYISLAIIENKKFQNFLINAENGFLNFYFLNKDSSITETVKKDLVLSMNFFNNFFKTNKSLNIVEIPGAGFIQSLPGILLIGSEMLKYYNYPGFNEWPPHEVAHQWMGAAIYIRRFNEYARLFLEESLTEHLKLCFIKNRMGDEFLKKELSQKLELYQKVRKTKGDIPVDEVEIPGNYREINGGVLVYQKGTLLAHNFFNNLIHPKKYQLFWNELYNTFNGQFLKFEEFINLGEKFGFNKLYLYDSIKITGLP